MLNFYINRAGTNLSKTRPSRREAAKDELRDLYHRERRAAWPMPLWRWSRSAGRVGVRPAPR